MFVLYSCAPLNIFQNGKSANDYFSERGYDYQNDEDDLRSFSRESEENSRDSLRPESISPARSPAKIVNGRKSRNRTKSKSPSRNLSVSPARNKSKSPTRNKSKSPSRNNTKNVNNNVESKPKTKSILQKDPSKRKNKKKLDEIQQAIRDAENEDYKGISQIILRGDGNRLIGRKSHNEEVQRFLEDLPESLVSYRNLGLSKR